MSYDDQNTTLEYFIWLSVNILYLFGTLIKTKTILQIYTIIAVQHSF